MPSTRNVLLAVVMMIVLSACLAPFTTFDEMQKYELGSIWCVPHNADGTIDLSVPPRLIADVEKQLIGLRESDSPDTIAKRQDWMKLTMPHRLGNIGSEFHAGLTFHAPKGVTDVGVSGNRVIILGGETEYDGRRVYGGRARRQVSAEQWRAFYGFLHGQRQGLSDATIADELRSNNLCQSQNWGLYYVSGTEYASVAIERYDAKGGMELQAGMSISGGGSNSNVFVAESAYNAEVSRRIGDTSGSDKESTTPSEYVATWKITKAELTCFGEAQTSGTDDELRVSLGKLTLGALGEGWVTGDAKRNDHPVFVHFQPLLVNERTHYEVAGTERVWPATCSKPERLS